MLVNDTKFTSYVGVRLPHSMKKWLRKRKSKLNRNGGVSSEIILILEEKFLLETGAQK